MNARLAAVFFSLVVSLGLATACGGGDPEGEATWETHTTAEDESAGGEAEAE